MKATVSNKTILKYYWDHARKYPRYIVGLIFGVPVALLTHQFLPPLIAAGILNRLSTGAFVHGQLWASFGHSLLIYSALIIFGGVFAWRFIIYFIWKMELYITRDINKEMFAHLMMLSAHFHANSFGGSLVSQTNKLVGSYGRLADTTVFQAYTFLWAMILTTVILLPRVPYFVASLLAFTVLFIFIAVATTKRIRKLNAKEAKVQNKQTGYIADMITNVMAVKSYAAEDAENARFKMVTDELNQAGHDVMWASTKKDVVYGSVTTSINVLSVVMATASVVLFKANIATVFLVLNYTGNILERLWEFSQTTLRNYNRALGDAYEGVTTIHEQSSVQDPETPETPKMSRGSIAIKDMTFAYDKDPARQALFSDFNLRIKPGEKIGLVGHSGSGKTSLLTLLMRFVDVDKGSIMIDGQDIRNVRQDDLHRLIAYVPQEPLLFHRSIAENIAYSRPDASEAEIEGVAKMANAHEFISSLPNGYETLVGERGVKLSGGQRQRVAIARAMLKNAPILVLDEATSALDSESEALIQDALWKLMERRTAIVIAHRLSTIQKMDRIIVLDKGKIVEQGSHKELVRQKGMYASLWNRQSGGFLDS